MQIKFLSKIFLILFLSWSPWVLADEQDALFANPWVLATMNGKAIDLSLYPQRQPGITFGADNRYAAFAGCNQIAGSFFLNGVSGLEFSPNSMMTKMSCAGPANIEDEFTAVLPKVKFWTIQENQLLLQDQQQATLLSFSAQAMK